MEITVIDDSDIVGWMASATREGEIYMQDVASMVRNVLAALVPYRRVCAPGQSNLKMNRLNILDHGNDNGLEIGSDWITPRTVRRHEPELAKLNGNFAARGFVHLQHCNVGSNRSLMCELARIFGVDVYAGTGKHNPVYRFNTGSYIRATPGGTYTVDVGRP